MVFITNVMYLLSTLPGSDHRISTIKHDTIIDTINLKAVTFLTCDIDLENENKNWQEPVLEPTDKNKRFCIYKP